MLAGEQQAAVTVAVEGLMDAKPIPELEAFATFDPKVSPNSAVKTWCTTKLGSSRYVYDLVQSFWQL